MKIGMVCPYSFDEPGGVQAHILDLAEHFIAQGHHVEVLGPCSDNTDVPSFVMKGGRSIPIRYNGSVARLALGPHMDRYIRSFITNGNFDVLHIHEPNSPSYSMRTLRLVEGPIVATYHASSSGSLLLKAALPALRPLLEKIRGGIAVSEMARRWQVEQLGGDSVLIPNGVDTARFRKAQAPRAEDDERPLEIVFLGRLDEPRKGLDILLAALAHVQRPFLCSVIGGGTPRHVPNVTYAGRVSDQEKAEILGRADIYVAPNTGGESFGIVLVEAMAAGCAVVASDIEAFRTVCNADSAEPAGLLFANGDSADLARSLQQLIDAPDERAVLQQRGRERAAVFDWDKVSEEVMRVYETVADGTKVHMR